MSSVETRPRHGEYRTKRVILEIYDALADARWRTGVPYQTRLDPPPVEKRFPTSEPATATVSPLRSRARHESERPAQDRVAEERATYEVQPSAHPNPESEAQAHGAEPDLTEEVPSATSSPQHQAPDEPQDALFERPVPQNNQPRRRCPRSPRLRPRRPEGRAIHPSTRRRPRARPNQAHPQCPPRPQQDLERRAQRRPAPHRLGAGLETCRK